ncbi:MAG: S1 family peptidase [Nitrosarchaeum sp.]|nr:S1 family peptidase [Nitrosarchaeum sp.]
MLNAELADIPLVASYLDADGKLIAVVDKDGNDTKEGYAKKIKDLVDNDIELSVHMGYFERESCTYRDSNCDPLYGGIKMYQSIYPLTNGIGATNNNGVVGFVTSSHAVGSGTGQDVMQGGTSSTYKVGDVLTNPSLNGRYSDAAFVDLNTVNGETTTNKIYRTSSTYYTASSTGTPGYGTHIQKTGYQSGETDGYVIGTGLTVYDATYGSLVDQYAADYTSVTGDSGSPVYSYRTTEGPVTLYGIHVGKVCLVSTSPCPSGYDVTVFSKWINVKNELGLNTVP